VCVPGLTSSSQKPLRKPSRLKELCLYGQIAVYNHSPSMCQNAWTAVDYRYIENETVSCDAGCGQVQLNGNSLQQQLITTSLQPAQQAPQQQSPATQNIIVHQLPAQPQPTQLSVPQQIIITAQPPQPAPPPQQPAQLNLQQLQQVSCTLQLLIIQSLNWISYINTISQWKILSRDCLKRYSVLKLPVIIIINIVIIIIVRVFVVRLLHNETMSAE